MDTTAQARDLYLAVQEYAVLTKQVIGDMELQLQKLVAEVRTGSGSQQQAQQKLAALEAELLAKSKALEAMQKRERDLLAEGDALTKRYTETVAKLNEASASKEQALKELEILRAQGTTFLTNQNNEVARLQSVANEATAKVASLEAEINKQAAQRNELQTQLEQERAKAATLASDLQKGTDKQRTTQDYLSKLNTDLKAKQAEVVRLTGELTKTSTMLTETKQLVQTRGRELLEAKANIETKVYDGKRFKRSAEPMSTNTVPSQAQREPTTQQPATNPSPSAARPVEINIQDEEFGDAQSTNEEEGSRRGQEKPPILLPVTQNGQFVSESAKPEDLARYVMLVPEAKVNAYLRDAAISSGANPGQDIVSLRLFLNNDVLHGLVASGDGKFYDINSQDSGSTWTATPLMTLEEKRGFLFRRWSSGIDDIIIGNDDLYGDALLSGAGDSRNPLKSSAQQFFINISSPISLSAEGTVYIRPSYFKLGIGINNDEPDDCTIL